MTIQRSSITFEDCIWLGLDDAKIIKDNMPSLLPSGFVTLCRMHLTRELCGELGEILTKFSSTGSLNGDPSEEVM